MYKGKCLKIGIGFATGRKSFQKVLRSYIHNWKESGLVDNNKILLNIFVAYDLTYNKTNKKDYINMHPELAENIDGAIYIGKRDINEEIENLIKENIINHTEAGKIFGKGYASQRNAVLYSAIKNDMDYLIFLDDDEYPVAVTNTQKNAVWGGQHVLSTHIKNIGQADLTHGYHCGYISPIPFVEYNDTMTETDFRSFIEAISNDILNWDNIKTVMNNGGVTYADTTILVSNKTKEVQEVNHAKFISGGNLGINLTDPHRVFPFYNPPGARGEDTFLSTCLSERKVLKVPCYTFHDGFSTYNHLLEGVLPIRLKFIKADNEQIVRRFYNACIGWIRYKPLLLYITQQHCYEEKIEKIRQQLKEVLPGICTYFGLQEFINILAELEKYNNNVKKHYEEFIETQRIWVKMMENLSKD
ncbi:hypothetical protein [Dehalobacter restrictus]|uniref:Glycosyltransferase n=1 Tax=Dehalobacter restrictus (strain DSM 9455 / PER-K23) TaxID=871738 RepID=A0ABM5P2I8_DEHRP|nr:hypothetical protein [Dehalobacter restrictus]AHF08752.1 hypothetical protein DEHRE_00245 [Dehalobacter restrictus DSM 9455]